MKKKQKFLAPIYGLERSLKKNLKLDSDLLLRNVDLLKKEYKFFEDQGLGANYNAVLEIDYKYDSSDPNEPYPGISLNVINRFDSALLVYGDGVVGVAGIFPASKSYGLGGIVLYSAKTRLGEGLDKEIDDDFISYYKNFIKAYDMRPLAFDVYRRSRDRFANNDRAIDSCTVLESIFVPQVEKSKKPFVLNGMKIMGFGDKEVELIDDLIEYRNAVIHADRDKQLKLLSGPKYTHKWFEDTFKLVRKILSKYVEIPWD
ncbi:MAG TPA: hypothetical protein VJ327_01245 [Patescibacteria group bacterium]|nr:hypothetical protein [Patescibacteria group bacterium]